MSDILPTCTCGRYIYPYIMEIKKRNKERLNDDSYNVLNVNTKTCTNLENEENIMEKWDLKICCVNKIHQVSFQGMHLED